MSPKVRKHAFEVSHTPLMQAVSTQLQALHNKMLKAWSFVSSCCQNAREEPLKSKVLAATLPWGSHMRWHTCLIFRIDVCMLHVAWYENGVGLKH